MEGLVIERVTVDPIGEDATLVPLDLVGLDPSWGIYLLDHEYPPPELETQRAGSVDTEGDPVVGNRYLNRMLSVKVRVFEPSDPAGTNLATNPIGALATTSWAATGFAEVGRAVVPRNTPRGLGIDTAVTATFVSSASNYVYHEVPVTNGKTYRASVYVQKRAGGGKTRVVVYNAAGAAKKAESAKVIEAANATQDGWVRIDVQFVADATATWRIGVEGGAVGAEVSVTGLLVEQSAELTPFFCGDTPGCDWTGARHASMSTRPAPDGTRFKRIYRDLTRKLDRITRQKVGYLRRISAIGQQTYDLRSARISEAPQDLGIGRRRAEVTLTFEALPFGRGPEIQIGGNFDELALPVLTFLAENVPGDVPGLGRLVLEDRQGQLQRAAWWGLQQLYYNAAASAALFFEAESRTPLGSAAVVAVGGASGGSVVRHQKLVNAYQAVLSTQATGGGAHLSHVGSYRVLARMFRPPVTAGEVSVKLAWTEGDFVNVTENDPVVFGVDENESVWTIEDLGIVTLKPAPAGTTQRWEGRVLAKSTAPNDWLYVDWLWLIPVDEGSGEVRASTSPPPPTSMVAFDPYEQAVGAITGKAAGLGGVYVVHEGSDTDDFAVDATNDWLTRTAVSDTGELVGVGISGRAVGLPVNLATVAMAYDLKTSNFNSFVQAFQFLRYKDKNNFAWVRCGSDEEGKRMWVDFNVRVAGASTFATGTRYLGGAARTSWHTLTTVISGELFFVFLGDQGGAQTLLLSGQTAQLAALAAGGAYIGDRCGNATATTRYFDNLEVWEPVVDAAIYPNRTLEVRSNEARRRDSAGVAWGQVPYEGDFLLVPPAGPEKQPSRITAKGSRNADADEGIDDIRGNLFVTPRYLYADPT